MPTVSVGPWRSRIARPQRTLLAIAVLAAAYVAVGRLGLAFATVQANVTLLWAPTGLALAALYLFGARIWPGIWIGAAVVNWLVPSSPSVVALIATGNTLEALAGYYLLRRFGLDPRFRRSRDVVILLALGAGLSTTVSASIGVAALMLAGSVTSELAGGVWLQWWLGDATGAVIVTPMLLVGLLGQPSWRDMLRRAEAWVVQACLLGVALLMFASDLDLGSTQMPVLFAAVPLLIWAGLRLGPRGAMIGSALTSLVAVCGTARGVGLFAHASPQTAAFELWAYVATVGAAALILAAAVAEREDAIAALLTKEKQQRQLEQEIRHVQRVDSLGVLAGGVAHDFNNLLTVMRGNASLLRNRINPEDYFLLDDLDLASQRAAELCEQLLTYAGKSQPSLQEVQLGALTREIERLLTASVSKKVRFSSHYGAQDPPVRGDPSQLRQVVMNLILNASDATEARHGAVRISTEVEELDTEYLQHSHLKSDLPAGRYAVFTVEDEGVGMDEETLNRIFDPFFTTKDRGRGLGLAAALGIVRTHGGALKVESTAGIGTRFRVILPVAQAQENKPPLVALAPGPRDVQRHRVLVVDDEPAVRDVLHRALSHARWSVAVSVDGLAALSLLEHDDQNFDALVLDLTMPNMDGIELLRRARRLRPNVPAILMSGFARPSVIEEFPRAVFLAKPFTPAELLKVLDELLGVDEMEHSSGDTDDEIRRAL